MNVSNSAYVHLFWVFVLLFLYYYYSSSYNQTEYTRRCDCGERDSFEDSYNSARNSANNNCVSTNMSTNNASMLTTIPTSNVSMSTTASPTNEGTNFLSYYKSAIFDRMDEKNSFTIVILTYKRIKTLPPLLLNYCKTKYLSKIVVIWNDVGAEIPQNILQVNNECAVPVAFVRETENKLTNRFKPRKEIETDCEYVTTSQPTRVW